MRQAQRVLSEAEATLESFHDCHVHGLRWRGEQFAFYVDLQYILEWIQPTETTSTYQFRIAEGRLAFANADDVDISIVWKRAMLDAQIESINIIGTRATPNGTQQRQFEIAFSEPDAVITLWSTGYEVQLTDEPVISDVTSIRAE
jgi:hypothetical protein